jgi:hypothetical protein
VVRKCIFKHAPAIFITNTAAPNLGVSLLIPGDPGGNDFSSLAGIALVHDGTAGIMAHGNSWNSTGTICTHMQFGGSGTVTWGILAGNSCP